MFLGRFNSQQSVYVDSSTAACTNAATWSTASSSLHMDAVIPGLVHGDAVGTGTVTATLGSIFGQTTVNVSSGGLVVATPTFSPTGGTYSSVQTVTVSTTTPSATTYYTTDGSIPTTDRRSIPAPLRWQRLRRSSHSVCSRLFHQWSWIGSIHHRRRS